MCAALSCVSQIGNKVRRDTIGKLIYSYTKACIFCNDYTRVRKRPIKLKIVTHASRGAPIFLTFHPAFASASRRESSILIEITGVAVR